MMKLQNKSDEFSVTCEPASLRISIEQDWHLGDAP